MSEQNVILVGATHIEEEWIEIGRSERWTVKGWDGQPIIYASKAVLDYATIMIFDTDRMVVYVLSFFGGINFMTEKIVKIEREAETTVFEVEIDMQQLACYSLVPTSPGVDIWLRMVLLTERCPVVHEKVAEGYKWAARRAQKSPAS